MREGEREKEKFSWFPSWLLLLEYTIRRRSPFQSNRMGSPAAVAGCPSSRPILCHFLFVLISVLFSFPRTYSNAVGSIVRARIVSLYRNILFSASISLVHTCMYVYMREK